MIIVLKGPVGDLARGSRSGNHPNEVKKIKSALHLYGFLPDEDRTPQVTPNLIKAIKRFQALLSPKPDGRIDPRGRTLKKLNSLLKNRTIIVSLEDQILSSFEGMKKVHSFHCTSGKTNHITPKGIYSIYRKHRFYRSKTYDAQMDYAMFFLQRICDPHGIFC